MAIAVALVLVIALGDALIVYAGREADFAAFETAGANLAGGMAAQTSRMLGEIDDSLQSLTQRLDVGDVASGDLVASRSREAGNTALLHERLQPLRWIRSLVLVDARGRVAARAGEGDAGEADLSQTEAFRAVGADASPQPFLSAPEFDATNGAKSVVMARRLTDAQHQFAGAILATVSLKAWEDFYSVAMPPRRTVTVMRNDGVVLLRYPAGRRFDRVGGLASFLSPGSACASYHGPDLVDGAPVVASVCRFRNLPLAIQTSATQKLVLADWRKKIVWQILVGVLAALGAMVLLRLFAKQLLRLELSELSLAAEKQQAEIAHRQLDIALSNIAQGVCFFDCDNRLIVCNRRYRELYDLPADLARPGAALADIVAHFGANIGFRNGDVDHHAQSLTAIARGDTGRPLVIELGDGLTIAIQIQGMADGGWIGAHEDITERRKAEEQIAFFAKHDALTGLANRSLLLERLATALDEAKSAERVAVLFLDLDRFKSVNDTHGHPIGDALLRKVAARLIAAAGEGATVARLGGDEFVVFRASIQSLDEVGQLAARIVAAIATPYKIAGHQIVIGVSVGIDVTGESPTTAEALLKSADIALYIAKAQGRGNFRFFEPAMDRSLQNRDVMKSELRRGLSEGQFELLYRPAYNAASGAICGFETLARWNHPERGRLSPQEFMAVAEECGLTAAIGEWMIRQACRQAAQWPVPIRVAVNLSAAQLRALDLAPMIGDALADAGLAAGRLELEIPEPVLSPDSEPPLAALQSLAELGVRIVMDDFGIKYSSLNALRQFPFNKVKIDRSFIADLTSRPDAVFFLRAILDLCRNLGVATSAKGVDSWPQLEILFKEGCEELQGHVLGRPVDSAGAAELIQSGRVLPSRQALVGLGSAKARVQVIAGAAGARL